MKKALWRHSAGLLAALWCAALVGWAAGSGRLSGWGAASASALLLLLGAAPLRSLRRRLAEGERLARALDQLAGQQRRLLASRDELLSGVSHQLRTPLQRAMFAAEALRSECASDDAQGHLDRLTLDLEALDGRLEEMLVYSRIDGLAERPLAPVDLRASLAQLCRVVSRERGEVAVRCLGGDGPGPSVLADSGLLRRALSGLLRNAAGRARSRVEATARSDGGFAVIDVSDDGPLVPLPQREQLFEPFSQPAGGVPRGGLAMALVRRIVEAHGGHVEVAESSDERTRFRLSLPAR